VVKLVEILEAVNPKTVKSNSRVIEVGGVVIKKVPADPHPQMRVRTSSFQTGLRKALALRDKLIGV